MSPYDITTADQLAELYREPTALVKAKKAQRIDDVTKAIVEASPFFLFATSGADGSCDVSPRGGPPGQLIVLDESRVAFPDLNGNNLIDSFRNVVENPHAGLLVITPGRDETVRIDGRVQLTTDPALLGAWEGLLRTPKLAVIVNVDNVFIHCAKSFRRGEVWNPASWARYETLDDPMAMLHAHTGTSGDPAQTRADIEGRYALQLAEDRPDAAT